MYSLGIDIGGTKCAVVLGKGEIPDNISDFIIDKIKFPTNVNRGYNEIIKEILSEADELLKRNHIENNQLIGVGISCGGPLNSKKGVIMCPPNLPDWDNVPIVDIVSEHFGVTVEISNADYTVRYCGLDTNTKVKANDQVKQGDVIGTVAVVPCEKSDVSHIHVEVKVLDKYIDPLTVIMSDM